MYKKLLFCLLIFVSLFGYTQTNAPSIQSGVSFQWSDIQTDRKDPATIESITVNGNIYFSFGIPTGYEMTQVGPNGHNINRITENGVRVENNSSSPTWNTTALDAFQSLNLNYYFEANGNGDNICDDYVAEETTDSQKQTLFYDGGIVASSSGVIAVTERNANNCLHIEFFGYPEDSTVEQSLGETFINQSWTQMGFGGTGNGGPNGLGTPGAVNPPPSGSDYWLSDRVIENRGTIGIALFYLDDIAPTGSIITKATITAASNDNGDGKMFILTLPDHDKDGMSDVDDLDDDNDGIKDLNESNNIDPSADHDLDGTPNYKDSDFCTLNSEGVCENLDFDSDGIPNHFDLDSDNDGILDVIESNGTDEESDSSPTEPDGKADGKIGVQVATMGIPYSAGTGHILINTDGTGNYNFLDIDSDDDGIPDNIEGQLTLEYISPSGSATGIIDIDKNGFDDNYTLSARPTNSDRDSIPDYLDLDSDGDGIPDIEENGMANSLLGIDSDSDGLDNRFEGSLTNDHTNVNDDINSPEASILPDTDGDLFIGGDLDYRDTFDTNPPESATIDFDGIDDYLSGDSFMQGLGEVTIMAWVKIDASNTGNANATIAGEGLSCRVYVSNGNRLMFGVRTTAGTTNVVNGISVNYNEWHHVAGTFSNTSGELIIYVDGKQQTKAVVNSLIGKTILGSFWWNGDFEVGRMPWTLSDKQHFKGDIDEVRVFNTALSDEQIQQMVYQEIESVGSLVQGKIIPKPIKDTKTQETVSWSSLLAYYPMKDIKNNTTIDFSGNEETLKLMNITTIQEQTAPIPYQTSSDGDWSNEGTWLHGNVWDIENASNNKDWSIVNIENNVTSSSSHTNLGLIIDADKKLTINGDHKVENNWYLELNGTLDLQDDSQLVQTENSDLVTSATGKILRRQEGNASVYWYNYWASPVGSLGTTSLLNNNSTNHNTNNTDYSLNMLKKPNGTNFEFTSSYNETGKLSTRWLYTYKNGVTYYDWAALNQSTAIQSGIGYTAKGTGVGSEQQYVFEGKPNNGTIIINVEDTGGSGSVPAVTKTDYLLGNPYASAIDIHKFIDDNEDVIDGTIQLWQ